MKLWQKLALICSGLVAMSALLCSAMQISLTRDSIISRAKTQADEKQRSLLMSFQDMSDRYTAGSDSPAVKQSLVKHCFECFADESAVLMMDGETWYSQLNIEPLNYVNQDKGIKPVSTMVELDERQVYITGSAVHLMAYPDKSCLVYVVEDMSPVYESLDILVLRFALIGIFCAALGSGLVIILVRRTLRPLHELRDAASLIAAGDYSRRLNIERKDELGALAHSFDAMADAVHGHVTELCETNRRQRLFIGGVSHEFKTPLTGIILSADSLQNTCMTEEEQSRALEHIEAQTGFLEKLVQKMLRLMTLEREISIETLSVPEFLEAVEESRRAELEKRGLSLVLDCRMDSIMADRELLQSALQNLVDNAARASAPGQSISISARDNIIAVQDNGCGIGPEALNHVTEPFYMVDKARSKKHGGVGLGLALVKEICDAHGAELSIESVPGEGTKASIIFKQ